MRIEFGLHRSITLKPEEFTRAAVKAGEFQYQRPDGKVTLITLPKEWTDGVIVGKDIKIIDNDGKKDTWGTRNKEEEDIKNEKRALGDLQKFTEQVSASLSGFQKTISDFESNNTKRNEETQTLRVQLPGARLFGGNPAPVGPVGIGDKIEYLPGTRIKIDRSVFPKKSEDTGKENKPNEKFREPDPMLIELQRKQEAAFSKKSDSIS